MKGKLLRGALVCALLLNLLGLTVGASAPSVSLTVLFTHDTHDHFYPNAQGRGGYTRLATLLEEQRRTGSLTADGSRFLYPTVTLDGGDFSMGSLFQTIYTIDAPELRALGAMGFDVTTLGNHEFDYRGRGLADMLTAAKASGEALPQLVCANYHVDFNGKDTEGKLALSDALEAYPVNPAYALIEKEDAVGLDGTSPMKIAVFGLMGYDADDCAPMSGMALEDPAAAAKRVVSQIQADGGADFIICLSHGGTEDGKGEDYELAKAVEGIDLIISGHTHTELPEPIQVNGTYIVSCGEYAYDLGRITLSKTVDADHTLTAWDYRLIPVDKTVAEDPAMAAFADELKAKVDESYLSRFGLRYDQVLTRAEEEFTIEETGNLIGDAYISMVKKVEGENGTPVDFAVAPNGVIRDFLREGDVTTSQAYDILSLGSGADGSPGYPLVSVYLTGEDLKNAFEVDASVSLLMPAATLYGAGMTWEWNPNRMLLDRLTGYAQISPEGELLPIYDDQLYRVIADLYSGQMLGTVEGKSFGLLSVTPRHADGSVVTDLETCILTDEHGEELKSWYALAAYLDEQESVTPSELRKHAQPSWNPVLLLGNPGTTTLIVLGAGAVVLAVVALVVWRVRRRKR